MSPGRKAFDNREEFFVVNIIVGLGGKEFPGEECTWVHRSVIRDLRQDTSTSKVRGVAFNDSRAREIKVTENRGRGKTALEFVEGVVTGRRPSEHGVFPE